MRYRAKAIGGTCEILSELGGGCRIVVSVPIDISNQPSHLANFDIGADAESGKALISIKRLPSVRALATGRHHLLRHRGRARYAPFSAGDRLSEPEFTADDRSMLHDVEDEIAIFIIDTHCTIASDHGDKSLNE